VEGGGTGCGMPSGPVEGCPISDRAIDTDDDRAAGGRRVRRTICSRLFSAPRAS
jgi:hypothetical protein